MVISSGFAQQKNKPKKKEPFPAHLSADALKNLSSMNEDEMAAYRKKLLLRAQGSLANFPHGKLAKEGDMPLDGGAEISQVKKGSSTKAENLALDKRTLIPYILELKKALISSVPASVQAELKKQQQNQSAPELANKAISLWYNKRQAAALIMLIDAAHKDDASPLQWNNLGALLNLSGLHAQALPLLKFSLMNAGQSSMVLNNLGQAYLGIGDKVKAKHYLEKCLKLDPLNPEANRGMGILMLNESKPSKALDFFSQELRVAYRPASISAIQQAGLSDSIQYAEIFKSGNARDFSISEAEEEPLESQIIPARGPNNEGKYRLNLQGILMTFEKSSKPSFAQFGLNKIILPPFPKSVDQANSLYPEHHDFKVSAIEEYKYWLNRQTLSSKEKNSLSQKTMMYRDWALATADALYATEAANLSLTGEDHLRFISDWHQNRDKEISDLKSNAKGMTQKEMCKALKSINDRFVAQMGEYLDNRHQVMQARHKIYIDRIGQIVSKEPNCVGFLYAAVSNYVAYLASMSGHVELLINLDECNPTEFTYPETYWMANHLFEAICEKGISGTLPFGMVKAELNCEGLKFSGSVELLKFGLEKKFKSGTSTIWVGAGIEEKWKGVFEVEATQKLYVVWDKNNVCTDAGVKGTGKASIKEIVDVEFGYTFGVNSGFDGSPKVSGDLASKVEKSMQAYQEILK